MICVTYTMKYFTLESSGDMTYISMDIDYYFIYSIYILLYLRCICFKLLNNHAWVAVMSMHMNCMSTWMHICVLIDVTLVDDNVKIVSSHLLG